jgi:hypothetical protein
MENDPMLTTTQKEQLVNYIKDHSRESCQSLYQRELGRLSDWLVYDSWKELGTGQYPTAKYQENMERLVLVEEILAFVRLPKQKKLF